MRRSLTEIYGTTRTIRTGQRKTNMQSFQTEPLKSEDSPCPMNYAYIFNKPVGLILQGHSLQTFQDNIDRFKNLDWFWGTINRFEIAESILSRIGKKLDFLINYSKDYWSTSYEGLKLKDSLGRGNSLNEFLNQCIEDGVKEVYIFGGDGYSDDPSKPYIDSFMGKPDAVAWHKKDCDDFNRDFPKDIRHTKIINVSPNSKYTALNNISYEAFFDHLSDKK